MRIGLTLGLVALIAGGAYAHSELSTSKHGSATERLIGAWHLLRIEAPGTDRHKAGLADGIAGFWCIDGLSREFAPL